MGHYIIHGARPNFRPIHFVFGRKGVGQKVGARPLGIPFGAKLIGKEKSMGKGNIWLSH